MEAILLYFLSLLISIFIASSLHFFVNKRKSNFPPGTTGFPIIGETLHLASSGPQKFIHQRMEKFSSEIFSTSIIGERMAVFCGPEGNKFLLHSPNECVGPWFPPLLRKFVAWINPEGRFKPVLDKNRRFIHQRISANAIRDYTPVMDSMARQHLNTEWEPFEEVKVYPLVKKFALSLACRLVLGLDDPIQVQKFSDTFSRTMKGLRAVPINLPGTTYNRCLKEIENTKKQLLKIIEEKRCWLSSRSSALSENKAIGSDMDILSRMLLDQDANSKPDLEIAFNLVSLLSPSSDTLSSVATVVLKYIAELPHIYDRVYEEICEIAKSKAPEELLNWEDIQKMKYSWNVVCESLRLTPPVLGTFREVLQDLNFAGFTIPKGWKVFSSAFTTNKDPKYFPDPQTFDPTRHEGEGPAPWVHLPFSMGPRKCPGQEYAKLVILVYMYNVLRKFKLQKLNPDEKIVYHGGPVPVNGLPMRLQPLTN